MARYPIRIDRLDRGSVFLIISEGQPSDEYTVPVGFGHHVEGSGRWTVRIRTANGHYDTPTPGEIGPTPLTDTDDEDVMAAPRREYFRSWEAVLAFADRCVGGQGADLVQPDAVDIVRWARLPFPETVAHQSPNSERVRSFRLTHGLTQKQLAEHLQTSIRNVEDWEAGKATPPTYLVNVALPAVGKRITNERGGADR